MTACNCAAARAPQTPRTQPERRRAGDSTAAGAADAGKTPRRRRCSDAFAAEGEPRGTSSPPTPMLDQYLALRPRGLSPGFQHAAARLEQQLGALAEAMDDVERTATRAGYSPYMHQVVDQRARYQRLRTLTEPLPVLVDSLLTPGCVHQMQQLLSPSLVFPAATPMQNDFSGEMLHHARQIAELHKENLRRLVTEVASQLELDPAPNDEGKCADEV